MIAQVVYNPLKSLSPGSCPGVFAQVAQVSFNYLKLLGPGVAQVLPHSVPHTPYTLRAPFRVVRERNEGEKPRRAEGVFKASSSGVFRLVGTAGR